MSGRPTRGFTLIELLAVVAVLTMLAGLALPNFGVARSRALRAEAERLGANLELARQRAVATGIPHRVVVDLDSHAYWIEWRVSETRALGTAEAPLPDVFSPEPDTPILMAAPRGASEAWYPVPDARGRRLPAEVSFEAAELGELPTQRGTVDIEFGRDGTADAASLRLLHEDGGLFAVDVRPLADSVRLRRPER